MLETQINGIFISMVILVFGYFIISFSSTMYSIKLSRGRNDRTLRNMVNTYREGLRTVINTITVGENTYEVGSQLGYMLKSVKMGITITSIDFGIVGYTFNVSPDIPFEITRGTFHHKFQDGQLYHINHEITPQKKLNKHKFI